MPLAETQREHKKKKYHDQNPEETESRMKWDTKEEATIATMIQQLCECNVAVHLQYVKGHTDIRHSCFIDQLINET